MSNDKSVLLADQAAPADGCQRDNHPKVHAACLEVEPTTLANGRAEKRIKVEAAGPSSEQCGSSKHDRKGAGAGGGRKRHRGMKPAGGVKLAGGSAADPRPTSEVVHPELARLATAAGEGDKPRAACEPRPPPKTEETMLARRAAAVTSFATLMERVRAKERNVEASKVEPTAKRQRHSTDDMRASI